MKQRFFSPIWWQYCLPQHYLSKIMGYAANCQWPWLKQAMIDRFILRFGVDMQQALYSDPKAYAHFNAFFTRALKPALRPIATAPNALVSPCDGTISAMGTIEQTQLLQAKGQTYTLPNLLGYPESHLQVQRYRHGTFCTVYLAPKDYHRIHMPYHASIVGMRYIPGRLFSVNQQTTQHLPALFTKNERLILFCESQAGPFIMILVGAMLVSGLYTLWGGKIQAKRGAIQDYNYPNTPTQHLTFNKGEYCAHFNLGSTIILLFPKHKIQWQDHLTTGQPLQMGEAIGVMQ
jgi:phosphatidylserine decarboxylase